MNWHIKTNQASLCSYLDFILIYYYYNLYPVVVLRFAGSLRAVLGTVTLLKTSFLPCRKLTTTVTYTISLSGSDPGGTSMSLLGTGERLRAFVVGPAVLVFLFMTADSRLKTVNSRFKTSDFGLRLQAPDSELTGGMWVVCWSSSLVDRFCCSCNISWRSLFSIIFNDWASSGPCTWCPLASPGSSSSSGIFGGVVIYT